MTKLIRGLNQITAADLSGVATIGNFDGVHIGHQTLIDAVKKAASALQTFSMVILFEPQPLEYFAQNESVPRLTRFREKFLTLQALGVDKILRIRFTELFSKISATDFVTQILKQRLQLKKLIIGDDFRFGKGREGDVTYLKRVGATIGLEVEIIQSIMLDQIRVSSTRVRKALKEADHALVGRLLSRPYSMMGRVVHGDQKGRELGFPTANIFLHRKATPVFGVYIVKLYGLGEKGLPGVANVGTRPTVGGTRTLLEVHLFNFNANIYGRYVRVEFCEKIREELRLPNLDELKKYIEHDAKIARAYFKKIGEMD